MTTNHTKCNQKQPEVSTFCNLTEQWKKGELEKQKSYYIKYNEFPSFIAKLCEDNIFYGAFTDFEDEADGIQVLAPVPSYEEWQEEQKSLKVLAEEYCKEKEDNQQLKELLKECRGVVYNLIDDEPCRYDHHGYCQEHNWLSDGVCPHKQGKELITKIDNAIGEKK